MCLNAKTITPNGYALYFRIVLAIACCNLMLCCLEVLQSLLFGLIASCVVALRMVLYYNISCVMRNYGFNFFRISIARVLEMVD